jgi:hypothetical protein
MNTIKYITDHHRVNDDFKLTDNNSRRINSKVSIYNDKTGELIFEGHNKTVIAGSALTAMKLFGLDSSALNATPTYDDPLYLNLDNGNKTGGMPINADTGLADETQRKIIGFCVGQGGAGLDISDVFDVEYCSWIKPDDLIPFRYPLETEDDVNTDIYKGKATNVKESGHTAYYFKEFSNSPKLVQNYMSSIGTFSDSVNSTTVYENHSADKAQSFVELHLKITKDDCREYFITHEGINSAKINQISLVSAWKKTVESGDKEYEEFQDIRPFSIINIPNEIISNLEKSLSIVYSLYF